MPLSTFLSYCDIEDEIYDRIPMGKGNHVDFYEQYVKQVISFSSQYGSNYSISYAAANIIGPPIKFPKYGDFSQTFAMVCIFPSVITFIVLQKTIVTSLKYGFLKWMKDR